MAKTAAAATPAPDDDDEDGTQAGAGDADESEGQPEVIATILCNPDGSYQLVEGDEDEDESGAGGESEEGEGGDTGEPQGTRYDGLGALLKGVMETVQNYESTKSGGGTAEDNFNAGFNEEPSGSGLKPGAMPPRG